jgi:hypothetical protein
MRLQIEMCAAWLAARIQIESTVLFRRAIAGAAASAKSTEFGELSTIGGLSYRFREDFAAVPAVLATSGVLSRIGFLFRP